MENSTQTSNCTPSQDNSNPAEYQSAAFWLHNLISLELLLSFLSNTLVVYSVLRFNSLRSAIYMLIGSLALVEMMSLPVAAMLHLERHYRGRCDHTDIWNASYYTLVSLIHFATNAKYCHLLLIAMERLVHSYNIASFNELFSIIVLAFLIFGKRGTLRWLVTTSNVWHVKNQWAWKALRDELRTCKILVHHDILYFLVTFLLQCTLRKKML